MVSLLRPHYHQVYIYEHNENGILSFAIVNFFGYLFFLLLRPMELAFIFYLRSGYDPLILNLVAVSTAMASQVVDYLIGYFFSAGIIDRLIGRKRYEKAEDEMLKAKDRLKVFEDNPKMKVFGLGKQRVRCPLLQDSEECVLYENRPIICRIYGVPFSLKDGKKEKAYACGLSGFQENVTYPTVKLDKIYQELCNLSKELFTEAGYIQPGKKANLMLPLSRILRMSFEAIVKGDFGEQ